MEHVLGVVKEVMLPVFDRVTDVDSCIEHLLRRQLFIGGPSRKPDATFDRGLFNAENLLLVKSGNRDFYITTCESMSKRRLAGKTCFIASGKGRQDREYIERHEKKCKKFEEEREERLERYNKWLDQIFNNREWCEKAMEELERRKAVNIEALRAYGLEV